MTRLTFAGWMRARKAVIALVLAVRLSCWPTGPADTRRRHANRGTRSDLGDDDSRS